MSNQWIYLDNPHMKGSTVRRWQEMLLAAGYKLPNWGADADFGSETDTATRQAQADLGLLVDGIVGPKTMDAMHDKLSGAVSEPPASPMSIIDGVEVHDYRGHAPRPSNYSYDRTWDQIAGVVLHRTACHLGEKPERYFPVNAHIGVTLEGRLILAHRWEDMIWHGHAPSRWTIGIEFDGNPEGYPGYHWKPGGGPHDITPEQVKAGDVLLKMLMDTFQAKGEQFKYIYAHRQSSENRECDPGWQAWQKIAIPWMAKTGATPGDIGLQGTVFGTGYHISQHWDPRSPIAGFRVK